MKNNKKLIKYLAIIAILAGIVFPFFFIKKNYREGLPDDPWCDRIYQNGNGSWYNLDGC